jgi:hypothetical protein
MPFMSHNNGGVTNHEGELALKYVESPLDVDDGSVGDLNFTPHCVNPLIPFKISPIIESL